MNTNFKNNPKTDFKKIALDLLFAIWKVEGLGSPMALTLKSWLLQNYGSGVLPEIDKLERDAAGQRKYPEVQAQARRMQSFRHPASTKPNADSLSNDGAGVPQDDAAVMPLNEPMGKSESPLNLGAREEQILSAPTPEEQLPGTQTLSQPSSTPQAPGQSGDVLVVPEFPDIKLTPKDVAELLTLSPRAVLKKYGRKTLEEYLKSKGRRIRPSTSDRQVAAQFLLALGNNK